MSINELYTAFSTYLQLILAFQECLEERWLLATS
jgi:hypothetical protein